MKIIGILVFFVSAVAIAGTESMDPCQVMKNKVLGQNAIASNIANWNTTRTPEGGPYRHKSLVCKNEACEVVSSLNVVIVYEPGHPDANSDGYVQYPYINLNQEMKAMHAGVEEYKAAEKKCPKGTVSL